MIAVRFLVLLALLAAPLAAEAQPAGKMYRVGYLSSAATVFEPFRQALRELGYVEGQNLVMEPDSPPVGLTSYPRSLPTWSTHAST